MTTTHIHHSRRSFRHSPYARDIGAATIPMNADAARHLYRLLRKGGLDAIDARCEVLLATIQLRPR